MRNVVRKDVSQDTFLPDLVLEVFPEASPALSVI